MPHLEWIGKEKVVNHAKEVPFHVLERKYSFGEGRDGMVIHGDNLLALKSLLPEYEGKVRCIYIDPPYNTGNEGWVYNDNVNDPRIKKWLGEVVGKEGEDLSRHDKWLCMMYPRLKLLHRLLAQDGAIFISIDDNELYNLKSVCDEIFGVGNFVANISWQRTYSKRNDSKGIPAEIEHIVVYAKKEAWNPKRLPRTEEMNEGYKNLDGDTREWSSVTISAPGAITHQGMVYAIQHPITGEYLYPPTGRCWSFGQPQMFELMNEWAEYELQPIDDFDKRCEICGTTKNVPVEINAIVMKNPSSGKVEARSRYEQGIRQEKPWPMLYFTGKGRGGLRRKQYLDVSAGRVASNLWLHVEVGHTGEATNELTTIFETKSPFDTPKPTRLIQRILQIATDKDSIILDSFAGSGTTAHAVLNLNKKDGGNRKFILIEMMDYAETITAERVRRVISGYGAGKNAAPGTGGGFDFYEIGAPLMEKGVLNENISPAKIRRYVWYMETHEPPMEGMGKEDFLGIFQQTAYYFHYRPKEATLLDEDYLATITEKAESYVIYADRCLLSEEFMARHHIVFKKIPRDIAVL